VVCQIAIARTPDSPTTRPVEYYHTDLLGSTRVMSDGTGELTPGSQAAYTAFGLFVPPSATRRLGYAGAYGYQTHEEFSFQHVGARYYDPATGRFLQRDPIGITGGINVYEYVRSLPTARVDPDGMYPFGGFPGYQPPSYTPRPPKPPKPPSPQEELERVKRRIRIITYGGMTCAGILAFFPPFGPLAAGAIVIGIGDSYLLDELSQLGSSSSQGWRSGCKCGAGG
jgi:RHS repeat-associated protein